MKKILCLLLLAHTLTAKAQNVMLDATFADDGVLVNPNASIFADFALQSSGKIIVAGPQSKTADNFKNFVLTRYNTDGSLDKSFGKNGYAGSNGNASQVFSIAMQNNDAIVAIGSIASRNVIIQRYLKNGDADTTFGNNGNVIFSVGINAYSYASDVVLQPDNKIVVCGYSILANQTKYGLILRYLTNGLPDSSFGNNGTASWQDPDNGPNFAVTSLALQQSGQILVNYFYNETFVVNRYNINGTKDAGFGIDGTAQFQNADNVVDHFSPSYLNVQTNGKITASGYATQTATGKLYFAAGRLNADGSIDKNYGNNGLQHIAFSQKVSGTSGSVLQSDGKLVIAGSVKGSGSSYAMARLTSAGTIDSGFGNNGTVITKFDKSAECHGILLQPDNKILLGGNTGLSAVNMLVARYTNSLSNKVSIPTQPNNLIVKVSPNPARNYLQVEGLPSNQKIKLSVADFTGNVKMQLTVQTSLAKINIASLQAGNYLLKIEVNNAVTTKTFLKE